MAELWIAFSLVALPCLFGLLFLVDATLLVTIGLYAMAIGVVIGLPGSIFYHVALYRVLKGSGPIPRHWIWRPTSYHHALSTAQRPRVMRPFYIGAFGFTIAMLGSFSLIVALARS